MTVRRRIAGAVTMVATAGMVGAFAGPAGTASAFGAGRLVARPAVVPAARMLVSAHDCVIDAPSAPQDLWFDYPESGLPTDAYLLWHPPTCLADKVTEYQVTLSPNGQTVTVPPTPGVGGPIDNGYLAALVNDLKPGATYTFQVRGRIGTGPWGAASAPVVLHGSENVLNKPGRPAAGTITLRGEVTDGDTGKPMDDPDNLLQIQSRPTGSSDWDGGDYATLNKDGTYSITLPYQPDHEYIAHFGGVAERHVGPWYSGSDSAIVRVP